MELVIWLTAGAALGFVLGWGMFSAKVARLNAESQLLHKALDQTRHERTEFHERAIAAETSVKNLEKRLSEREEQLRTEFKNTANTIFEDITTKFSNQSEKKIGDLLNPLRERLSEFQKKVDESFSAQGKEQHSLKNEIEKFARLNESLVKAFRGDVKTQGNWGEIVLERILEASGLRRGEDYILQGAEMKLADAEGNRLKPDVIIKLPDNKHIVVDAKVSITAYDRYCNDPQEAHLKDFLKSVRAHISGLEGKRYQDIEQLGTPDFVFMFMPVESAFAFAMQHDPELLSYALDKGITIVPPTSLFANLRTVASLWNIERQNKNAQEIARQGGAMYDKFVGFIEDMQSLGLHMKRLYGSYDQAMSKLSKGTGNLIGRAEKLKALGAKTSKSFPTALAGDNDDKVVTLKQGDEY